MDSLPTRATKWEAHVDSLHSPQHTQPPPVSRPPSSPVWVMSSAEQGSEEQRTSQAMNSSQECHRNFHSEDGFSVSHLQYETFKTHPLILAFFSPSYLARIKAGQWEEIHFVWRPLFCLKWTKWLNYGCMAVRCSFICLPYWFIWPYEFGRIIEN